MKTWDELKKEGSDHYKSGSVEPIDLYRNIIPHGEYNTFDIKALADIIKYAARMLNRGYSHTDIRKIIHYAELLRADMEEE